MKTVQGFPSIYGQKYLTAHTNSSVSSSDIPKYQEIQKHSMNLSIIHINIYVIFVTSIIVDH